jgi:hypothetical protein
LGRGTEEVAARSVLCGPLPRGPVEVLDSRDVEGDDLRATPLELIRPESLESPDVESTLARQRLGQAISIHVRAMVEHAVGDHAWRELDRVVPPLGLGELPQLLGIGCLGLSGALVVQ